MSRNAEAILRAAYAMAERASENPSADLDDSELRAALGVRPVDGGRSNSMDPVDEIGRICDDGESDKLSRIAAVLGLTEAREKAIRDEGFNMGTIAALACVTAQDCGVTWGEIVRAAGTQDVLRHALSNEGDWEWGGFKRYAIRELGQAEVTRARRAVRRAAKRACGVGGNDAG